MQSYTTKAGDMWDMIAKAVYGNERFTRTLIAANTAYAATAVFGAGVVLAAPEIERPVPVSTAPWRRKA